MKILFIINSLMELSGSERVAVQLANQLIDCSNYDVTIINRDTNKKNSGYTLKDGVNVHCFKGNLLYFYNHLNRFLRENTFDYIVIHNMGRLSLLCALLNMPKDTKLISLEHVAFLSRARYVRVLSKILYSKIHQVVCLTKNDSEIFHKIHENIITIPNFSSFPVAPSINRSFKKIVAVGRLTDQKNFMHLLQAWQKISHKLPEWSLDIYGEGELKSQLQNYIKHNDLEHVNLYPVTKNIQDVYLQGAFLAMSSKYEGLPMVLIESQSFGLPVISYNCPHGPSEVITDGYNGFLVENQNIEALAMAILKLANDPALLTELSQNALISAQKYQPEAILTLWQNQVFNN